jgi:hypothetical protein
VIEFTGFKTYTDSKNKRGLYIRWEGKSPILTITNLRTLQREYYIWSAWLDLGKQTSPSRPQNEVFPAQRSSAPKIHAFYNNYLTGEFFDTQFLITPENLLEYGNRLGPSGGIKQEVIVWLKNIVGPV